MSDNQVVIASESEIELSVESSRGLNEDSVHDLDSSQGLNEGESSSDEEEEDHIFRLENEDFHEVLGRAKDLCAHWTKEDVLDWECLNTVFFMKSLNEANNEISEEEYTFMK